MGFSRSDCMGLLEIVMVIEAWFESCP
jgi:hypothetical protein